MTSSFDENFFRAKFLSLGTERSYTGPNPENRVDEESIHSSIRSFVIATVDFVRQSRFKCLPNTYASFLAEIWPEGVSKSGSFEMSRHQMDCSAISWKFIKLIK